MLLGPELDVLGIARFVDFQRVYEAQQYMTASMRPYSFTMGQQTPHRHHTALEWATIVPWQTWARISGRAQRKPTSATHDVRQYDIRACSRRGDH